MPDRWTIARVVNRVHRDVLTKEGFARRGNVCTRADNGLVREVRFSTPRWGDPAEKGIQVLLVLSLAGLPGPIGEFRRDALWTHLEPEYPRPARHEPPPAELLEDVAGPALDFLCRAEDLRGFAAMAHDVHREAGSWGPFKWVYPGGTAPLQAAAYAALLAGDEQLAERFIAAVVATEKDRRELRDFHADLAQLRAS